METTTSWTSEFLTALDDIARQGLEFLPGVFGALLILVLGWLLARMLRGAIKSLVNHCNQWLQRAFIEGPLASLHLSKAMITVIGDIVYWSVIVLAVTAAAHVAGLSLVSQWLSVISTHIPNVVAAFAIFLTGYLFSLFVKEQLLTLDEESVDPRMGAALGNVVQSAILGVALIVGLDQLGVDVLLLIALAIIAAGSILLTLGLSFAFAARPFVSNLVGIRSARSQIHVGMRIRAGEIEGKVIELSASQLILETQAGKVLVPGRFFDEQVLTILTAELASRAETKAEQGLEDAGD